jgi:alkylmercury lyase-like protein
MSYETIPLPEELGRRLRQGFLLETTPRTLGELAKADFDPSAECSSAYLISDKPTRHQVRFEDVLLYTHCVVDTFVLPSLRKEAGEISSVDPVTEQEIRFRLTPHEIEATDETLSQAVVSIGASEGSVGSGHTSCCPFINLFARYSQYEQWVEQHPEALTVVLPLKDAVVFAQDWLADRLANSCC